jgi:periplasmic protein TonB
MLPNNRSLCIMVLIILGSFEPSKGQENFNVIETPAEFPGGISKFYEYVGRHIKYPKKAGRNGIGGRVYVEFIITENGTINRDSVTIVEPDEIKKWAPDPDIYKSISTDESLEAEAIRVIRESPPWQPGMQKGKPVRQRITMPIIFKAD